MNRVTIAVSTAAPIFKNRVEKDAVSLAVKSPKFVTLSSLYDANVQLLGRLKEGDTDDDAEKKADELATAYWDSVTDAIPEWASIRDGALRPAESRAEFVHSHAVSFWALGDAGRQLLSQYPDEVNWKARLTRLAEVDWRKTNPEWQGICMLGSDIITRRQTKEATSKFIQYQLGLIDEKPEKVLELPESATTAS
jgi:DNA sulfur modification protein DndB